MDVDDSLTLEVQQLLANNTKTKLQEMAISLEIKKPGTGWPRCCPPNGLKEDIARAIAAHSCYKKLTSSSGGIKKVPSTNNIDKENAGDLPLVSKEDRLMSEQNQDHGKLTPVPDGKQMRVTEAASLKDEHSINEEDVIVHRVMQDAIKTFTADFRDCKLRYFPRAHTYGLQWLLDPCPVALLQHLLLDRNSLQSLPEEITALVQLRRISVKHNHLKSLPQALHKLTFLQILDVSHNKLPELPDTLTLCTKLQQLVLDDNLIQQLPSQLGALQSLKELGIGVQPHLQELPRSLGRLVKSLTALWFRDPLPSLQNVPTNLLKSQPSVILQHLSSLDSQAGMTQRVVA